jgi:nitroreductase
VHPVSDRVVKTQELLALPKSVVPLAIVALGYPAEKKGAVDRYDPSRVRRNTW